MLLSELLVVWGFYCTNSSWMSIFLGVPALASAMFTRSSYQKPQNRQSLKKVDCKEYLIQHDLKHGRNFKSNYVNIFVCVKCHCLTKVSTLF